MKYLTVCILLFAVLIGFSFYTAVHVTEITTEAETVLQYALTAYDQGKPELAVHLIENAFSIWIEAQTALGIFLCHDDFDSVQTDLASLHSYAQSEDLDDFRSICESLISKLSHIREMEWPHIGNIL